MSTQPPPVPPQQPPPQQQPHTQPQSQTAPYQAPAAQQQTPGGSPTASPLQRLTGEATPGDETNGFALASFVLGIVSLAWLDGLTFVGAGDGWLFVIALLVPIAAGALGYYALQQTGTAGAAARGRQLAIAGLVLAALGALILFLTYIRLETADGPFG